MTNLTPLAEDLNSGTIARVVGTRILDGEHFTVVEYMDGSTWAYAPMHLMLLTGEIARQV